MKTKEQVYDAEISPLMTKILQICKENRIAMIADFALNNVDFHCTSSMLTESHEPLESQLRAWDILKPKRAAFAFAETIETLPDGTKRITTKRIL